MIADHAIPHEVLTACNEDAAAYYRDCLHRPAAEGPRGYLRSRGLGAVLDETPWTVGYAPPGWTHLRDQLADLGYSDSTLVAAGVCTVSRRGTLIDRFRDRLTFGIRDADGALLGFTARRSPGAPADAPKYLNTPQTSIFTKSRVLFGLGERAVSPSPQVAIAEGALDALAISAATDNLNPLALCGSVFTTEHRRCVEDTAAKEVILAFDGDDAGTRAMLTAGAHLSICHVELRAMRLSGPEDPAGLLVAGGSDCLKQRLRTSPVLDEEVISRCLNQWPDRTTNAEAAIACLRSTCRHLVTVGITDPARDVRTLAEQLPASATTVTQELTTQFTGAHVPRLRSRS